MPLPPRTGGGAHSPAGEGLGESQFRRREKSLALCILCGFNYSMHIHLRNQLGSHPCVAGLVATNNVCHLVHYHSDQHFQLGSTPFFLLLGLLIHHLASSEVILHCLAGLDQWTSSSTDDLFGRFVLHDKMHRHRSKGQGRITVLADESGCRST